MKRLEHLPEITDRALGGLTADAHLKLRIEKAAAGVPARQSRKNWIPALSCALAMALIVAFAVPAVLQQDPAGQLISSQPAGSGESAANERALLDLGDDRVSVGASQAPEFRSIWAKGESGSFPMIGVNGRYYRLMTTPGSVSSGLKGESLGTVDEFTTEPALSGTDVLMSNTVSLGTEVYEVDGMGGTMIAAEVDSKLRVFQRVSFNGSALMGSETLSSTLRIPGRVVSLSLSDVGVVTDASTCRSLLDTLLTCASYESSATVNGKQSLLIELDNGLLLQMIVKNDNLSACGTWSCPEFFEAFDDAVN